MVTQVAAPHWLPCEEWAESVSHSLACEEVELQEPQLR